MANVQELFIRSARYSYYNSVVYTTHSRRNSHTVAHVLNKNVSIYPNVIIICTIRVFESLESGCCEICRYSNMWWSVQ